MILMSNKLNQSCFNSRRHDQPDLDLDLKEWSLKARISRENTHSRRFSASNLRSFREETNSFRSNFTISSTASSPGYIAREEIDPSTYSFTTALKALQAKTVYSWEYLSPEGLTLHSKWSDAEKYISNPLSGEVPLECLSAKTLSQRSFRSLTSRITMSAPLIYPSQVHQFHATKSPIKEQKNDQEKKTSTRDVGTQSTPADLSSSSPSPVQTPSIRERTIKHSEEEGENSSVCSEKFKSDKEVPLKETREQECTKRNEGEVKEHVMCRCTQGGCISLRSLWRRKKQRNKHKTMMPNKLSTSPNSLSHIN